LFADFGPRESFEFLVNAQIQGKKFPGFGLLPRTVFNFPFFAFYRDILTSAVQLLKRGEPVSEEAQAIGQLAKKEGGLPAPSLASQDFLSGEAENGSL